MEAEDNKKLMSGSQVRGGQSAETNFTVATTTQQNTNKYPEKHSAINKAPDYCSTPLCHETSIDSTTSSLYSTSSLHLHQHHHVRILEVHTKILVQILQALRQRHKARALQPRCHTPPPKQHPALPAHPTQRERTRRPAAATRPSRGRTFKWTYRRQIYGWTEYCSSRRGKCFGSEDGSAEEGVTG